MVLTAAAGGFVACYVLVLTMAIGSLGSTSVQSGSATMLWGRAVLATCAKCVTCQRGRQLT
eukprot:5227607-Alexandrium_andersonii.AAC.1